MRTVRVPPQLWRDALAVARSRGETLSSVIVKALEQYVKRHGPVQDSPKR